MDDDFLQLTIVNESGKNILEEDVGTEIQYTKDYGTGLDVHAKFIQVSVLVKRNLSVFEFRREFKTDWNSLISAKDWVIDVIKNKSIPYVDPTASFHYCLESTSTYHFVILKAWEGVPSVINPSLARAGRKKTDILDAKMLAISDLTGIWPPYYLPGQAVEELRMLVTERAQYMKRATQITNHINSCLLKLGLTSGKNGSVTKSEEIRSYVEALIDNTIDSNDETNDKSSCPITIPKDLLYLFSKDYTEYDNCVDTAAEYLNQIRTKINSMMWETETGELPGSEMIKILTSAPGIGEMTAIHWLARVVTPRRFHNAKALAAYCGCDPSLKVSAGKVTSTVKRGGRRDLHSALCQAATNLMRVHSEPFGRFGYNIAMQTGVWKKGANALARKLAVAMYYMSLRGEYFSYEKYGFIDEPDVINISIEELIAINPSFKRYINSLTKNNIMDTKTLVHHYATCKLKAFKGLGKNFFAIVKEFIENQDKYKELYERLNNNA